MFLEYLERYKKYKKDVEYYINNNYENINLERTKYFYKYKRLMLRMN